MKNKNELNGFYEERDGVRIWFCNKCMTLFSESCDKINKDLWHPDCDNCVHMDSSIVNNMYRDMVKRRGVLEVWDLVKASAICNDDSKYVHKYVH